MKTISKLVNLSTLSRFFHSTGAFGKGRGSARVSYKEIRATIPFGCQKVRTATLWQEVPNTLGGAEGSWHSLVILLTQFDKEMLLLIQMEIFLSLMLRQSPRSSFGFPSGRKSKKKGLQLAPKAKQQKLSGNLKIVQKIYWTFNISVHFKVFFRPSGVNSIGEVFCSNFLDHDFPKEAS